MFKEYLSAMRQAIGAAQEVEWVFPTAPHPVGDVKGGFAWWSLPPGVRSFQATEFVGFEESAQLVEDVWRRQGPFDAVLGFSQGAMLLSVLLARGLVDQSALKPARAILFGAAWPNPYGDTVRGLTEMGESLRRSSLRTLHVYSMHDPMNPGEMAEQIADCYGPVSERWVHGAHAHVVPQTPADLQRYIDFLGL
eukprot:GGOE01061106.1.p2 GENE.GGOE01061106.1~~GGOE01061106.1.p2  ORF type:complete len:217 (+),score=51.88 GGOE01061106.1:71-652(+)